MENNQQRSSYLLPISILVAAVVVAGALVYNAGSRGSVSPEEENSVVANVGKILGSASQDQVVLGDPKAPVKIVEFADFQCPFCGRFHKEAGAQIREEYIKTGKANIVMIDLAFLGPESTQAAMAAHCAGDQGKYWAYSDYLYEYLWDNYYAQSKNGENVGAFSDANLKKFAKALGLDSGKFDQCLDSKKYAGKVEAGNQTASAALRQRLSTPSIFVGEKLIQGAQPYEVFKQAIEEELNK